jgi:hypothetical protein
LVGVSLTVLGCAVDIIDRFAETLDADEIDFLIRLHRFIEWYVGCSQDFVLSSNDDVALCTSLMEMGETIKAPDCDAMPTH